MTPTAATLRGARLTVEAVGAARDATDGDVAIGVRVSQDKVNDLDNRWDGVA